MKAVPTKYLPISGIFVGAVAGAVYWTAAQLWPSSIAVVLSLFAIAILGRSGNDDSLTTFQPTWLDVFVLLIQYNTLMALTAANLPFPAPANVALGLIMICGQAASHGLVVSVLAARPLSPGRQQPSEHSEVPPRTSTGEPRMSTGEPRISIGELIFALAAGFAPAAVLGIPGLAGLVAAIVLRLGLTSAMRRRTGPQRQALVRRVQPLTEACFYLGALATWKYV